MEKKEELYQRIKQLKEEYVKAQIGRKQIFNEMLEAIKQFRMCSKKYKNELYQLEMAYKLRNYFISDYRLVMDVILNIANKNGKNYGMKEIIISDFVKYNENKSKQVYGKVLIITTKDILDTIDETKYFFYDSFASIASKIINNGNSLVMVAPNYFEGNIEPKSLLVDILRKNLKNGGFMGNISCFLQGDELEKAVNNVIDYIDINGPDFQDIDENVLSNLVLDNCKGKTLVKN